MRYLFILLLLVSCGSRKVNKSNTETKEKSEIIIVDSLKKEIKTDSSTEIQSNEFEIEPIDSIKPIIIIDAQGKKTSYLNARLKYKQETKRNKTLKNELVQRSRKTNIKAEKRTQIEVKQIERKESIITSLWWLWLLIILVIIYYVNRKFRIFF
jgi:hypothetical protein